MCGLLHSISFTMLDLRQAILEQPEKPGLTINQLAKRVKAQIPRSTVYAYLRDEEDSLSKTVSILLDAVGLKITTTKRAMEPRKRGK
jgi:AcrR family transcriptional regulator